LRRAVNYIESNYSKDIALQDIAGEVNITKQHLCRIFKNHVGITPNEYIAKKRIQEAKALLLCSEMTIMEIANEVGYQNNNYFTIIFKKFEGVTPSIFRQHVQRLTF
jgi:YesN/AraC family two-component response regulator